MNSAEINLKELVDQMNQHLLLIEKLNNKFDEATKVLDDLLKKMRG